MIWFWIYIVGTFVAVTMNLAAGQAQWFRNNWSDVRCNPAYMLVPAFVDVETDVSKNFINCVTKSFNDYAGLSMDGMNSQMGLVGDSLGTITSSLSDMRGMMGETRGAFGMVFQMVFGKIQNLMSSMQYLMIRIRTLMGRIVATFATMIYAASGAMQTGEAVWNGPIGRVARL